MRAPEDTVFLTSNITYRRSGVGDRTLGTFYIQYINHFNFYRMKSQKLKRHIVSPSVLIKGCTMALCVMAASWSAFAGDGAKPTTLTSVAQESRKITGKVIDAETKRRSSASESKLREPPKERSPTTTATIPSR